ncbi:MAG: M48 family metallopeptidase [Lachnospiraceae bacterium]|nr:M48 family metallopeptidase [Lachnospiraceae bacterium]
MFYTAFYELFLNSGICKFGQIRGKFGAKHAWQIRAVIARRFCAEAIHVKQNSCARYLTSIPIPAMMLSESNRSPEVYLDYNITRSKRRTISLFVLDGKVEVRAPYRVSKSEIDKFVHSKTDWIKKQLDKSAELLTKRENFSLTYGDELPYRGVLRPIICGNDRRASFAGGCFSVPPDLTPPQIKAACVKIYRQLAKEDICEKVRYFASWMGVSPAVVKINGAKSRWGSCSAQGNLNFSWRLLMADDSVIDYVVVHELAHLKELNHSVQFWAIVERTIPDCRERKRRLRELQKKLAGEDWD